MARQILLLTIVGFLMASPVDAAVDSLPAPIAKLADQGLTIVKQFDAPGELSGYAARVRGNRLALYLTPDGQHVIVGSLFDADGTNLTRRKLKAILGSSGISKPWKKLAASQWIGSGNPDAPVTVYEFVDPNCPYCHQFFEATRKWVKSGRVQIRHILVAILKPSSFGKAAAILQAEDPEAAFKRHQHHYPSGGIDPAGTIKPSTKKAIAANTRLMSQLEIRGTPGIVYRGDSGDLHIIQGLPDKTGLKKIMEPE